MKKKEAFQKVIDNMNNDYISESCAQCAYYTVLSFIPFVILLLTLIQFTSITPETLIEALQKIIPDSMSGAVIGVVQEVYSKSIGTISISIIFALWSAGKGLYALMKGLHTIYKVKDKNGKSYSYWYLKFKSILQTIIFIFLITVGLLLLVFGNTIISIIQQNFGGLPNFNVFSMITTELIFILGTFIVFTCIYKFMPKHKVSFKSQMPGALFGAIGLNLVSFVFSKYLDIFKGFSVTYGSLTTIMLVMMWIYSCFYTLFLGAEINKNIKYFKNYKESEKENSEIQENNKKG